MQEIQFFGPMVFVGGRANIIKDQEGNAVYDLNNNGKVDTTDSFVLTRNSIEGCSGQTKTQFDKLRAHVGPLGRASAAEVAESMTKHEWAGTSGQVTDLVPCQDLDRSEAKHSSTVFHFEGNKAYAEFIFQEK